MSRLRTVDDVVAWRLCLGCGACAYICPEQRIKLYDFVNEGIRPVRSADDCGSCDLCVKVCPAVQSDFRPEPELPGPRKSAGLGVGMVEPPTPDESFMRAWGQVLSIQEGHATDPEIRFRGSSGGVLTALSAYCLEVFGMYGVLHIEQNPEDPARNRTRLSRTRAEVLAAAGSRYSPASVCNGLGLVQSAPGLCAIIGKPSDIAAVQNARKLRPELNRKIGVTLSFFCAESPATAGTLALLARMGIDATALRDLRYRGLGWPGHFAPTVKGESQPRQQMKYQECWAFLRSYRPLATHLWPDGSGECADITCGDPWYKAPDGTNPGSSMVVARTARGLAIVKGAVAAGYLELTDIPAWKLSGSQPGLQFKKASVWGRRLPQTLLGLPTTHFEGAHLRRNWTQLSFGDRTRVVIGAFWRMIRRGLYRRHRLDPKEATPIPEPTPAGPAVVVRSSGPV